MISVTLKLEDRSIEITNEGPHAAAGILLDVLTGQTDTKIEKIVEIVVNPHAKVPGEL